ncbi:MAG: hypothetical protein Q9159_003037 [Coniocarpon cinnabarinum]
MPKGIKGVLVECDPSIKAIIEQIDSERNDFIIENLGDEVVVIKESKLEELKVLEKSQAIGEKPGGDNDSD